MDSLPAAGIFSLGQVFAGFRYIHSEGRPTGIMDIDLLLVKLAKPAQRAILGTGVTTLEQLASMTEEEVFNLHGIGKNAMQVINATLHENGLSFAGEK